MKKTEWPMQKERVFSRGGAYEFVVAHNILLHKEAIETASEVIVQHLFEHPPHQPLRVLDLACGGKPVVPAGFMERLGDHSFAYTGVDINGDQVEACRSFSFPENVVVKNVFEGNVWDLDSLPLKSSYDLVFIGLNTHHGIPEEIVYAAREIHKILDPHGLLLNHDVFRPEGYGYIRRPDVDPHHQKESMYFVTPEKLAAVKIPNPLSLDFAPKPVDKDWRQDWMVLHEQLLRKCGAPENILQDTIEHVLRWDFSVSLKEMKKLLTLAGFDVSLFDYNHFQHPLPQFYALAVGYKKGEDR